MTHQPWTQGSETNQKLKLATVFRWLTRSSGSEIRPLHPSSWEVDSNGHPWHVLSEAYALILPTQRLPWEHQHQRPILSLCPSSIRRWRRCSFPLSCYFISGTGSISWMHNLTNPSLSILCVPWPRGLPPFLLIPHLCERAAAAICLHHLRASSNGRVWTPLLCSSWGSPTLCEPHGPIRRDISDEKHNHGPHTTIRTCNWMR